MSVKAAIFDLDGTLVDSFDAHFKAFETSLEQMGASSSEDEFRMHFGKMAWVIVCDHLKSKGLVKTEEKCRLIAERKNELFLENVGLVRLIDGVIPFLDSLSDLGIPMSVATNSSRKNAYAVLESTGILDYFTAVLSCDDVQAPKPDPMMLELAASLMEVSKKESIVIEDSVYGIMAAKQAGMFTLGVLTGGAKKSDMQAQDADIISNRLDEVDIDELLNLTQ